jgi:predicted DCC family thiol-disulfide oxidoreductase YuxK
VQAWAKNRIHIQPWQAIPQIMSALGLTDADGMEQVWFVNGDGRLTGGAAAVNEALKWVWWGRPLATLYHLPGIKQLQDRVYRWVAANRHRLPGSSLQCNPARPPT